MPVGLGVLARLFVWIFGWYIAYIFYRRMLGRCNRPIAVTAVCYSAALLAVCLADCRLKNPYITVAVYCILLLALAFLLYPGGVRRKIGVSLFLTALCLVSGALVLLLLCLLSGRWGGFDLIRLTFWIQSTFLSKFLEFIVVLTVIRLRSRRETKIPIRYGVLLMSIPVVSLVEMFQHFYFFGPHFNISNLFAAVGLLYINIIVYVMFEALEKETRFQLRYELSQQQLGNQIRHYENLIENRRAVLKMMHDMNNHIATVYNLARNGRMDTINEYIHSVHRNFFAVSKTVDTGHPVIDAVLDEKKRAAEGAGIGIAFNVTLPDRIGIDHVDLCIVLGNALDNAIEACRRIRRPDVPRKIEARLSVRNDYFTAAVDNTTEEETADENLPLETSKKDRQFHGYGLQNIRETVERYDGNVKILRRQHTFSLNIVMKMKLPPDASDGTGNGQTAADDTHSGANA